MGKCFYVEQNVQRANNLYVSVAKKAISQKKNLDQTKKE